MKKVFNLIHEVVRLVFLRELNLDRGNVSCLALFTQHFGSDFDFRDVEFAGEEPSATYLDTSTAWEITRPRAFTTSSLLPLLSCITIAVT